MGYDFMVVYKKGKENVVADALSWKPELTDGFLAIISFSTPLWIEEFKESYPIPKQQKLCLSYIEVK